MPQARSTEHALTADRPVTVWVEDSGGAIHRGVATLTAAGAHIRLGGAVSLHEGEAVALRVAFDPDRPTVAAAARVGRVLVDRERTDCTVLWTGLPPPLAEWLASRQN
jgi:hypothetical protein